MILSPDRMIRGWQCLSAADLALYADGELAAWRRKHCDRHMSRCVQCRNELAILLRTERAPIHAVPQSWMERASTLVPGTSHVAPWRWASTGAFALLVCLALAWKL